LNKPGSEELLDAAVAASDGMKDRSNISAILSGDHLGEPSRVPDWRNHVPEAVRERWADLCLEARLVAFIAAETAATREDWD
jgi:hypothetical protein